MATIHTSIVLADNISNTLFNITSAMNTTLNVFEEMQTAGDTGLNFDSLDVVREKINSATQSARQFEESLQKIPNNVPVEVTPAWNIQSHLEIFQNTGVERLNSEMDSLNDLMQMVINSQRQIGEQALNIEILPPNATWDINATNQRIEELGQKITALQSIDISMLDDVSIARMNSEMESLRSNMNNIVNLQDQMNAAIESSDISQLNAGYNQLNGITEQVERRVREAAAAINELNNVQWQTPEKIEIFNNTGVERFQNEITNAVDLMAQLSDTQNALTAQAANMRLLPPNAINNIEGLNDRIAGLKDRLDQLSSVQLNDIGAEQANNEIEHLRQTLNQALQLQEKFNNEMGNFNVSGANQAFNQLNELIDGTERNFRNRLSQIESMDLRNAEWTTPHTVDIIVGSGFARYEQEISSANDMITRLVNNQRNISAQAANMRIFPPNAVNDINNVNARIDRIRQTIQRIEANPLNSIGTAEINNEVERLRGQLNQALIAQEQLNAAVGNMDVSAANEAYNRLNSIVDATERNIRDNASAQNQFNNKIVLGTNAMEGLHKKIMAAIAAYASIQGVKQVLGLSDELTQTTARLNMINDGLQTTQDLQNKIFLSSQKARSSYQMTADVVSKLGMQAGQAFSSNDELIAFSEQLNKSFIIAGTNAQGIESVMYNLTQALSSGVLRGQDFNSVFSNAPNIIQNIADYLDVPLGQIRDMAAEGELSAQVVKNAMLMAAEETNAQFEKMPVTFSQIGHRIKNTALMAFQPILDRISEFANSPNFDVFVQNIQNAITIVANAIMDLFDLIASVAGFIADNWSWIEPVILSVAAAMLIWKIMTLAYAAAQWVANSALLACPVTWIIMALIVIITLFVIFTEQIMGALFWAGALFKNIGLWFANLGIAALNVIKNIGLWLANLGLAIWAGIQNVGAWFGNLGMGIWEVLKACASNVLTAFSNAWINIEIGFNAFVKTVLEGVKNVIDWLNLIPGVNIGTDGITSSINNYASKMAELEASKHEYQDIGEAWQRGNSTFEYKDVGEAFNTFEVDWGNVADGFNTFDVFQEGWGSDAYAAGAAVGADLHDKIMNLIPSFGGGSDLIPRDEDYASTFDPSMLAGNVSGIADNTDAMKDSMSATEEDLKYLRDIAERDVINRFTTAEVKVEFGGITNHVSKDVDLDGIVSYLEDRVTETLEAVAEGVHA